MNETTVSENVSISEFFKPKCPVKIGDRFYKNYRIPNTMLIYKVTDIQELKDENGPFFAITAKCDNIAVGQNVKTFSSRALQTDDYTILKK